MRQRRFFFDTKSARNHLRTDRPSPDRVLFTPHRNFHTAAGMLATGGRWGNGGVKNKQGSVAYASIIHVLPVAGCTCVVFDSLRCLDRSRLGKVSPWLCASRAFALCQASSEAALCVASLPALLAPASVASGCGRCGNASARSRQRQCQPWECQLWAGFILQRCGNVGGIRFVEPGRRSTPLPRW